MLIVSILPYFTLLYKDIKNSGIFLSYIYPGVVLASLSMVILFSKIRIGSVKWINWISKSVFAIYIIHQNPFLAEQYFKPIINYIYDHSYGFATISNIFLFLLVIFIASVLIDQLRKYIWKMISNFLWA